MDEIFASADCDCVDLLPSFELSLKFCPVMIEKAFLPMKTYYRMLI